MTYIKILHDQIVIRGKIRLKKILCHPLVTSKFSADMLHVLEPHETLNALFSQVGAVWGGGCGETKVEGL